MKSISRFLVISMSAFTILPAGCNTRPSNQSSEVNQSRQQETKRPNNEVNCADKAKAWFGEHVGFGRFDDSTSLLKYSSHFRKSSNQCFILVEDHLSPNASAATRLSVWDVSKDVQYGSFRAYESTDDNSEPGKDVEACWVQQKHCTSISEFRALVSPYMNN